MQLQKIRNALDNTIINGSPYLRLAAAVSMLAMAFVCVSMKSVIDDMNKEQASMRDEIMRLRVATEHGAATKVAQRDVTSTMTNKAVAEPFVAAAVGQALKEPEQAVESALLAAVPKAAVADIPSLAAVTKAAVTVDEAPSDSLAALRGSELTDKSKQARPRHLGGIYGNIVAYGSATATTGCVTLSLSGGAVSLALSGNNCNSVKCPPCFIITNGHASNKLTLSACSTAKIGGSFALGDSSSIRTNAILEIVLINADTSNYAIVNDGASASTSEHVIGPASTAIAYCYTGGSNRLYFPNSYFNNGLHTGTGSTGTGASIAKTGAISTDSTVTVAGKTTLNGAVDLGSATTDTVTLKGSVTTSGNPAFDMSGSSGTFSTSSSTNTLTGNAALSGTLTVTGGATFNNVIQMGNAATDTITIHGNIATSGNPNIDFSGSTGTFDTPSGTNTFSGAATASSSLTVTAAATLNGAVTLGDATTDAVTFKGSVTTNGNPNIDFSGSTGTFKSAAGANTFSGASTASSSLTVTAATTLNGAVTLGDATGDAVTFKGSVTTNGNPNIDFSGSTGTFKTTQGANTISGTVGVANNPSFDLSGSTGNWKFPSGNVQTSGGDAICYQGNTCNR